jgi:hypothetical protein
MLFQATKITSSRFLLGRDTKPKDIPWFKQAPIYILAGLTAEMVSGVIWTPMDVAKSRLQRGADKHTTARALLTEVWRKESFKGVFRVSRLFGHPFNADTYPGPLGILGLHSGFRVSFINLPFYAADETKKSSSVTL